jgi:hypothetical protein
MIFQEKKLPVAGNGKNDAMIKLLIYRFDDL